MIEKVIRWLMYHRFINPPNLYGLKVGSKVARIEDNFVRDDDIGVVTEISTDYLKWHPQFIEVSFSNFTEYYTRNELVLVLKDD